MEPLEHQDPMDLVPGCLRGTRMRLVPAAEVGAHTRVLCELAGSAFAGPPWHETCVEAAQLVSRLAHDATKPGFTLVIAESAGIAVGFAYGVPGYLLAALAGYLPQPDEAPFELRELAVAPQARGRGFGGALHDALIAATPGIPRYLTTHPQATPALALYRSRGWRAARLWSPPGMGGAPGLLMHRPR